MKLTAEGTCLLLKGWMAEEIASSLYMEVAEQLQWQQKTIKMFGKTYLLPRLTAWVGDVGYAYSGIVNDAQPWTALLNEARKALPMINPNSVLGNFYRDGNDSVSWHADNENGLGPVIGSLSLGASRVFSIRHNETREVTRVVLDHGDLVVMRGNFQATYQHSVPKTKRQVGPRINLTFRQML